MYTIIIIKKVTLIPASFVGSTFGIRLAADDLSWGIRTLTLSGGGVQVNWGDGTNEESAGGERVMHTYARAGEYAVRVSDGVKELSAVGGDADFNAAHAHKLIRFATNGRELTTLNVLSFKNCVNLASVGFAGSGLATVGRQAFAYCTGLRGRIDFPGLTSFPTGTFAPLKGCTGGITEIHFPVAMAETFGQSDGFLADPTLGTGTARTIFDLP